MRKKIVTIALVGGLGLGGAAGVLTPALAAETTPGAAASSVADRVTRIKDALKGLVTDGTINQAQADEVAATLAEKLPPRGHGGHGHGRPGFLTPEAIAKVLGSPVEELRAARDAGKTLAQVAQEKGIDKAELVDKLVAAAKEQLAAAVKEGRLTQAQADTILQDLPARIAEKVDRVGRPGGPGERRGPGGAEAPPAAEPSAPSASPSSTA